MKVQSLKIFSIYILSFWLTLDSLQSQQVNFVDSLEKELITTDDNQKKLEIYRNLIWEYRSDLKSAEPHLNDADSISSLLKNDTYAAIFFYQRGSINRIAGNFNAATVHLKKAEGLYRELEDTLNIANTLYQIGALEQSQGEYKASTEKLYESLSLYESVSDSSSIALIKNALGVALRKIGRREDALKHYQDALSIYESKNNQIGQADVLHNLGNYFSEDEDYDEALAYYKRQEVIDRATGYIPGLAFLYESYGDISDKQGRIEEAGYHFKRAVELWDSTGYQEQYRQAKVKLGRNLTLRGRVNQGIEMINSAIQLSINENDRINENEGYLALSHAFEAAGNYRAALEFSRKYESLKDSIRSKDAIEQMNELNAKYEAGKREQQIALLSSQNQLKDAQLKRKSLQQLLFAAVSFILLGILIFIYQYMQQKKKFREVLFQNEIHKKVTAISHLKSRISEILEQKGDPIEIRPLEDINDLIENQLTEKEYEVLIDVAKGKTNSQIASDQFISNNTVKFHLKNLYSKLEVANRKEAVSKIISLH